MATKLPYETLSQIVTLLKDDQASLLQINRTCKKLYTASCPLLYKSPQFNTINSFRNFATTLAIENGRHVRQVDLHMIPHRWNSLGIYDLVSKITEKTPDLGVLNLDLCSLLTKKHLLKITKPLSDLRLLSLNQCDMIGDDSIEELVKNCPYIQELYLGGTRITDSSLNVLATQLILLTHLYIPGCEYVTEIGINKVIRDCKTIKHLDCRDCFNVVGQVEEIRDLLEESEEDQWTDDEEDDMEDGDTPSIQIV